MGPPQWYEPLDHMSGLLTEEESDQVFERLEVLVREGDPGEIVGSFTKVRIVLALPKDSARRRELARRWPETGSPYDARRLDADYFFSMLPEQLAHSTSDLLHSGRIPLDAEFKADETYIRRLIESQRIAPRRSGVLYAKSFA